MTAPAIPDAIVAVAARTLASIYTGNPDDPARKWNAETKCLEDQDYPNWHDYRDDARAALTAAVPLMVGWRPIESEPDTTKAPWDGKPVDLSDHLERWTNMRWKDGWFRSGDRAIAMGRHCFTHWSPILSPPPAEGGA